MAFIRRLALVGFVTAVILLTVGTGGTFFSAMDRGANIPISDNPFTEQDTSGTVGDTLTVLSVDSGFVDDIGVDDVSITSGGSNVVLLTDASNLRTSDEIDVLCDSKGTESLTIEVTGTDSGVSTSTQETVEVSCAVAPSPSPPPSPPPAPAGCDSPPSGPGVNVIDSDTPSVDIDDPYPARVDSGVTVSGDFDNEGGNVFLESDAVVGGTIDADGGADVIVGSNAFAEEIDAEGEAIICNGAAVNGLTKTGQGDQTGDVTVGQNADIGSIDADNGGSVTISQNSTVTDAVDSAGAIDIGPGVTVDGQVKSGQGDPTGDVTIGENAEVNKIDADNSGNVTVREGATVNKVIDSEGAVTLGPDVETEDEVKAGQGSGEGDVAVGNKTTVGGQIAAANQGGVTIGENGTVEGSIDADDDVIVGKNARVEGSIDTANNGDVTLKAGATVTGNVDAEGSTTCGSGATTGDNTCP